MLSRLVIRALSTRGTVTSSAAGTTRCLAALLASLYGVDLAACKLALGFCSGD